jgi:hypothetical protein
MKNYFYKRRFFFVPLAIAGFLSLVSLVVMVLWNELLPELFGIRSITFFQAMGLFILCKLLFGFGKGGGSAPWAIKRKLAGMTPEDRERFRHEMHERMCAWSKRKKPLTEEDAD